MPSRTKNDFWVKLNGKCVTFYKSTSSIKITEFLYDSSITLKLSELIEKYGQNVILTIEHNDIYRDDCSMSVSIDSQRPATQDELLQILPQVKVEEEKLKKQREKQKLADEKRKLQTVEAERKTYERLRKKYGETKD